jgi:hypothetical protein
MMPELPSRHKTVPLPPYIIADRTNWLKTIQNTFKGDNNPISTCFCDNRIYSPRLRYISTCGHLFAMMESGTTIIESSFM